MPFGVLRWKIPVPVLAVPLLLLMVVTTSTGLLSPKRAEALDSEEQTFLATINDYRAQNGLGPLSENATLDNDARWMANDMATNNYFAHQDSLGRDPFARMDDHGIRVQHLARREPGGGHGDGGLLLQDVARIAGTQREHARLPLHRDRHCAGLQRDVDLRLVLGDGIRRRGRFRTAAACPNRSARAGHPAASRRARNHAGPATTDPRGNAVPTTRPNGRFGVPPIQFGHATGGSFLSGLLELAPALDRALNREAVRVVH